jgi:hypothetical protein
MNATALEPVPMAIHVWDGLAGESGVRMAISGWVNLEFSPPYLLWRHGLALGIAAMVVALELLVIRWFRHSAGQNQGPR